MNGNGHGHCGCMECQPAACTCEHPSPEHDLIHPRYGVCYRCDRPVIALIQHRLAIRGKAIPWPSTSTS